MCIYRIAARLSLAAAVLRERVEALRRGGERGSHAVEYAIGIGLGAAIILGIYASYKTKLATVVTNWFFGGKPTP